MADVVGKTIFSDGKGKLFFGYYKTDDGVQFVDYKTWKKLSFKDVSKGDTNKERVIKAILKGQKQFNKKVEFNMWAKQKKRTFEETMDWFIQNGWINNINKGGIKESVDVLSVNEGKKRFDIMYNVGKTKYLISYHDGKKKHKDGSDFFDMQDFKNQKDLEKFKKALLSKGFIEESVNEATSSMSQEIASMTGTRQPAVQQFIDKHNINALKLAMYLNKQGLRGRMDFATALAGKPGNPIQKKMIKMFQESVNEVSIPQLAKLDAEHLDRHVGGKSEKEVRAFVDRVYKFYPKDVRKYMADNFMDYQKGKISMKLFTTILRVMHQDIREGVKSVNEAKFGYKDSTASYINKHNNEYKIAEKMNKGNEQKFYDDLQAMEDKIGHSKTMLFISNALRGYKVDMFKDPKIKNPADAQEALFLLSK